MKTECFGEEGEDRLKEFKRRGGAILDLEEEMNDHGASGSTHITLWCKGGCSREVCT